MAPQQTTEIDQALEYFNTTRQRVLDITSGLTEAQWNFRPAPDRWSTAQLLEHMVTVEERILGPVSEALAQAPPPSADHDAALVDSMVYAKIPDRSMRANAPEFLHPAGQLAPSEALDRLNHNYQRLAAYISTTPDLRRHALESPPLRILTNGAHTHMDGFQWALTVAAHHERHVRQIAELQADPAYPRGN